MYIKSKLAKSVRLALAVGAVSTVAISGNAMAQEEAAQNDAVEKIAVTGSRIQRTDLESASPISVFTAEDIAASGLTTLEDFVQNIPAINGAKLGNTVNNGNRGFATASLRGLGSGRTLVLINGRRFNSGDLNSIPVSIIERVDVVRDGASTIYGSDAIAGVINFITKRDFEGVEFTAKYDLTGEGDGETTKFSMTTGASSDKGNVVLSLEYTNRNSIWQGDRDFSECPLFDNGPGTEPFCGGSGTVPQGQAFPVDGPFVGGSYVIENGAPVPFSNAQHGYNYAAASYMVTPQEVFSANGSATYEISDSLLAFSEFGFANRQSEQLMAPVGTFWFPLVPDTNPGTIPFGPGDGSGANVYVARRLKETGGRRFTQDANDYRLVFGFEGALSNDWTWDVSYNYSRFVDTRVVFGQANTVRFQHMLDPDLCAANAGCPGVWNPFVEGTLTQEMIDYGTVTHSPVVRGTTKQFQANLQGDLGSFEIAGPIQWAVGVEKRWEDYLSQPDGAATIGQIYGVAANRTEGQYSLEEAYLEVVVPLLSDLPMVDSLTMTAAVRATDYDFLDDRATNSKFGLEWVPTDGLLVRATFAEGFRAPSITELFLPEQDTNPAYTDPCVNYGSNPNVLPNVAANCAADGLPGDFTLSSNQANAISGGNPNLEPEESESFTAGFVYSHDSGFSVALDYFDIEIENGIGTAGINNIVRLCYESQNFSSPLCDLIEGPGRSNVAPHPTSPRRDVLGNPAGVILANANLASFVTSGVDFDFSYAMDVSGGELTATLNGTWLNEYRYTPFDGADEIDIAGTYATDQWEGALATFNEWKYNIGLRYNAGDYSVAWESRFMSETTEFAATPEAFEALQEQNLSVTADSIWYHDVTASYYWNEYTFTAGVRNLTDEEPPYTTNNQDMNTINYSYDTAGRYFYVSATARF